MNGFFVFLGAVALFASGCPETGAQTAFWLGDAAVVTARETDDAGLLATVAADLTNAIYLATGRLAPIYAEDAVPSGVGPTIHLGATAAARTAGMSGDGMRIGDWRVKTEPGRAFLYGRTAKSVGFAVVEFAERVCDVWMVALDGRDVFSRDPVRTVPVMDRTVRPAIYQRSLYHGHDFSGRNKVTLPQWIRYDRLARSRPIANCEGRYRLSQATRDAKGAVRTVHSQFCYVQPEKHFKDHPEYFSMDPSGQRRGTPNDRSQICFTNPDTYRIALASLERFVEEDRAKTPVGYPCIYDFTQLDSCDWLCLCPACKKEIAKYNRVADGHKEGGDAGLQLTFVNRLARDIRKKYPDVFIRIYAYVSTAVPPKPETIVPESNVIIWWCDVYSKCDHTLPLETSGHYNELHAEEFRTWSELAPGRLQVWDYLLPEGSFELSLGDDIPMVYPDALKADAALFAKGAHLVSTECYPCQPFYECMHFLASHLYIDPTEDVDALLRTFCRGYGAAADDMYAAIQFLRREILRRPAPTSDGWHARVLPWLDRATLEPLAAKLQVAYDKVADDVVVRARLARCLAATWRQLMLLYRRSAETKAAFERACAEYRRFGLEVAEHAFMEPARRAEAKEEVETRIAMLKIRFTDLPAELKDVPEDELKCIEFHSRRHGALVDDPASECGKSLRSVNFKGEPFKCGVYDFPTAVITDFTLPEAEKLVEKGFRWRRYGTCHLGRDTIFWFPRHWNASIFLKRLYIPADGLDVDPNWYDLWVSTRFTEENVFVDRIALRRVPPPAR